MDKGSALKKIYQDNKVCCKVTFVWNNKLNTEANISEHYNSQTTLPKHSHLCLDPSSASVELCSPTDQ